MTTPWRDLRILDLPDARTFLRRAPQLLVGLAGLGFGLALMVESGLGLAPWDVLHEGIADRLDIQIGTVVIFLGAVVLLGWIPLRQRMGVGTILNAALVGVFANLSLQVLPSPEALEAQVVLLVVGVVVQGIAVGMYIATGLGPGPRDGLMTGIAALGYPVWAVRLVLEVIVLTLGFLLGGTVGIGTVLFALCIGPLAHVFLDVFEVRTDADLGPGVAGD